MTAFDCRSIEEIYNEPDEVPEGLYEALYGRDDLGYERLRPEAQELVGDYMGDGIPLQHFHVVSSEFSNGFDSREDLTTLIDHLVLRFASWILANNSGLFIVQINDIGDFRTPQQRIRIADLMGELGFGRLNDEIFVHQTMLRVAEIGRRERYQRRQSGLITRTPI